MTGHQLDTSINVDSRRDAYHRSDFDPANVRNFLFASWCSCFWLAGALGGGGLAQKQQPIDVIDEISHADFHCRPRDADCPHEQTCSTRERIFDLAALARRVASGMGLPLGFLRWTWLTKPLFSMNVSLAAER